ncbi:hypothetical protein [Oryza sativa Japonica Group]|uniref:Uncharacterized protein n=2 Tax=Oryza sativa subsp. japonica TaxID=39947 RepID=Q5VPX7_ORYSJ|nr:hypothetical protein [Oryza sativa Japonica Group]BAD68813.1 hypothetical protein [Oryza sativa Japonica Group]
MQDNLRSAACNFEKDATVGVTEPIKNCGGGCRCRRDKSDDVREARGGGSTVALNEMTTTLSYNGME